MAQEVSHNLCNLLVGAGIPNSPACHSVGFGNTVNYNGSFISVLGDCCETYEFVVVVYKVIVYFTTYKNNYAIKRDNVKKLRSDDDELLGLTERYIANSQDSMKILNDPKEYKMWGKYDVGTASRMMQAYEEQTKGK